VLAVGGEREVPGPEGPARADLRGLLAEQRSPDPQLALALQRDGLEVDAADQHQVPVQRPDLLRRDVERVVGIFDPLALGGQELDELR